MYEYFIFGDMYEYGLYNALLRTCAQTLCGIWPHFARNSMPCPVILFMPVRSVDPPCTSLDAPALRCGVCTALFTPPLIHTFAVLVYVATTHRPCSPGDLYTRIVRASAVTWHNPIPPKMFLQTRQGRANTR